MNVHQTRAADRDEWRMVFEVAGLLKETCTSLSLAPDREWLCFVLGEAADNMRSTVIWAAGSQEAPERTLKTSPSLPSLIVAADAARGDAVVASYCLDFMRDQDLIDEEVAMAVDTRLEDLTDSLTALSSSLRHQGDLHDPLMGKER